MAGELTITTQGDALTLYVILRRHSDAKVWDVTNTTWATWADGSIGDYDIVMTAKSGDLYQADFPTSIAAGTRVQALYYYQDGGAPATDDVLLWRQDLTWDGSGVGSGSSVSLDSRALTSLNSVKRRLGITGSGDDTLLTELINMASDRIERIAGRRFAASEYAEWVTENDDLVVRNHPIIRVNSIRTGPQTGLTVTYSGSDIEAQATVVYDEEGQNGALRLVSISAAGTETTNSLAFATYPTLSTLATAVSAVSGWTGTVGADDSRSTYLYPYGPIDCKSVNVDFCLPMTFDKVHRVNYHGGIIERRSTGSRHADFDPAPTGVVLVSYRGGYATIPDDVAQVCNDMVAGAFAAVSQNPNVLSETLGDWSYSLRGAVDGVDADMARLQPYMTFAVGGV